MRSAVTVDSLGELVILAGRLDVHSVAEVRAALHEALDRGKGRLVVDLAAVELVDATGLGMLVGTHRRADRVGRTLQLRNPSERVSRLLAATRLDRVLVVARPVGV